MKEQSRNCVNVPKIDDGFGYAFIRQKKIPSKPPMTPHLIANRLCFQNARLYEFLRLLDDGDLDTRRLFIGEIARLRQREDNLLGSCGNGHTLVVDREIRERTLRE